MRAIKTITTVNKYYNLTTDLTLPLSQTDNATWISGNTWAVPDYDTGTVYGYYVFNTPILLKDIQITYGLWCQRNSAQICEVKVKLGNDDYLPIYKNSFSGGYDNASILYGSYDFHKVVELTAIYISIQRGYWNTSYNRGHGTFDFTYTGASEATSSDYDYIQQITTNHVNVYYKNNIYKALKSWQKGQYYGN